MLISSPPSWGYPVTHFDPSSMHANFLGCPFKILIECNLQSIQFEKQVVGGG